MDQKNAFLGTEPIGRLLFRLAIPTVIAQLVNMLYNIVDRIYIGHMPQVGSLALTGLGVCTPIILIVSAFAALVASGGAPRASISMGKGDLQTAEKMLGGCFTLQLGISAVLTAALLIWNRDLLLAFGASEQTIDYAADYMQIYAIGTVFVQLTLGMNAFITAQGFAREGMLTVLIGAVCNIVLDPILIFKLGVFGASLATVLSQAISGVLCLLFIMVKVPILHITRSEWRPQSKRMTELCAYGVPMGLQYSITAIGSVILQVAVNSLGSLSVAAVTAASKVLNFLACPFDALGSTMATYGAQNVGASRYDRLNKGIYSASLMGFGYSLLAFGVAWFFGRSLTGLFVSGGSSAQLVELAQTYMITNVLAYPLLTLVNVVRFMIQGMGFSMFAILAGVMEMAARSLAGMFLVPALGYFGAALGSPLAWVAADLFLVPAYFRCRRVLMSQSHHLHVMGESAESN